MVIRPGVTRLKKTKVVYLLDLFEGREEKGNVIEGVLSAFR